ncbi:late embryogenesis abundant protein ecp63 [Plakobranchus ocellatus]|uniref:Late embryogenesis abundant protein ecp63 n=1 Tax=Plakobranchus ocellatus TaxID=259542 RepID=A0AAV4CWK3_9GAST|nr:late embryogenesis abundant protein ecp63 [Plakobranchus ocellatus]
MGDRIGRNGRLLGKRGPDLDALDDNAKKRLFERSGIKQDDLAEEEREEIMKVLLESDPDFLKEAQRQVCVHPDRQAQPDLWNKPSSQRASGSNQQPALTVEDDSATQPPDQIVLVSDAESDLRSEDHDLQEADVISDGQEDDRTSNKDGKEKKTSQIDPILPELPGNRELNTSIKNVSNRERAENLHQSQNVLDAQNSPNNVEKQDDETQVYDVHKEQFVEDTQRSEDASKPVGDVIVPESPGCDSDDKEEEEEEEDSVLHDSRFEKESVAQTPSLTPSALSDIESKVLLRTLNPLWPALHAENSDLNADCCSQVVKLMFDLYMRRVHREQRRLAQMVAWGVPVEMGPHMDGCLRSKRKCRKAQEPSGPLKNRIFSKLSKNDPSDFCNNEDGRDDDDDFQNASHRFRTAERDESEPCNLNAPRTSRRSARLCTTRLMALEQAEQTPSSDSKESDQDEWNLDQGKRRRKRQGARQRGMKKGPRKSESGHAESHNDLRDLKHNSTNKPGRKLTKQLAQEVNKHVLNDDDDVSVQNQCYDKKTMLHENDEGNPLRTKFQFSSESDQDLNDQKTGISKMRTNPNNRTMGSRNDSCIETKLSRKNLCDETKLSRNDPCGETKLSRNDPYDETKLSRNDPCVETKLSRNDPYDETKLSRDNLCDETKLIRNDPCVAKKLSRNNEEKTQSSSDLDSELHRDGLGQTDEDMLDLSHSLRKSLPQTEGLQRIVRNSNVVTTTADIENVGPVRSIEEKEECVKNTVEVLDEKSSDAEEECSSSENPDVTVVENLNEASDSDVMKSLPSKPSALPEVSDQSSRDSSTELPPWSQSSNSLLDKNGQIFSTQLNRSVRSSHGRARLMLEGSKIHPANETRSYEAVEKDEVANFAFDLTTKQEAQRKRKHAERGLDSDSKRQAQSSNTTDDVSIPSDTSVRTGDMDEVDDVDLVRKTCRQKAGQGRALFSKKQKVNEESTGVLTKAPVAASSLVAKETKTSDQLDEAEEIQRRQTDQQIEDATVSGADAHLHQDSDQDGHREAQNTNQRGERSLLEEFTSEVDEQALSACPICGEQFALILIEAHASTCGEEEPVEEQEEPDHQCSLCGETVPRARLREHQRTCQTLHSHQPGVSGRRVTRSRRDRSSKTKDKPAEQCKDRSSKTKDKPAEQYKDKRCKSKDKPAEQCKDKRCKSKDKPAEQCKDRSSKTKNKPAGICEDRSSNTKDKPAEPFIERSSKTKDKPAEQCIDRSIKTNDNPTDQCIDKRTKIKDKPAEQYIDRSSKTKDKPAERCKDRSSKTKDKPAEQYKDKICKSKDEPAKQCKDRSSKTKEKPEEQCLDRSSKTKDKHTERCKDRGSKTKDKPIEQCIERCSKTKDKPAEHCKERSSKTKDKPAEQCKDRSSKTKDKATKQCIDRSSKTKDKPAEQCKDKSSKAKDKPAEQCIDRSRKTKDKATEQCVDRSSKTKVNQQNNV